MSQRRHDYLVSNIMNAPIQYKKQEINGITVRPDSRAVILKAIEQGQAIEVYSGNDYINLYHVFERIAERNTKKYGKLQLVRQQIGKSVWLVRIVSDKGSVPQAQLQEGYDPKRGRYKRYAEQLANGEAVVLPNKVEAIKARRAWQLYVPSEKRRHLRSTVRTSGKAGKYVVAVLARTA